MLHPFSLILFIIIYYFNFEFTTISDFP